MTSFSPIPVAVISIASDVGQTVCDLIDQGGRFRVLLRTAPGDALNLTDNIRVIIFDADTMSDDAFDALARVREAVGDRSIILTSEALQEDQVRKLFRLNVADWLPKPLSEDKLAAALGSSKPDAGPNQNTVHAIISSVGGAGATTVAISMAELMTVKKSKSSDRVALFDLDFSAGDCSYKLNMRNDFDIASTASMPDRIDLEFVSAVEQLHPAGFSVFSFEAPSVLVSKGGHEMAMRLLDAVSTAHATTIVDIPYYETPWKSDVLSAVDTCTIVTTANLPSIKHAISIKNRIRKLRGDTYPIRVIVNKFEGGFFGQRIPKKKIEELFGKVELHFFADDGDVLGEANDRGVLPSEIKSSSSFLKAVRHFAKKSDLAA